MLRQAPPGAAHAFANALREFTGRRLPGMLTVIALLLCAPKASAGVAPATSELEITVLRCLRDAAVRPTIRVVPVIAPRDGFYGPKVAATPALIDSRTGAFDVYRFRVPSGRYVFRFETPHCTTNAMLFLLPHQRRHATAVLDGLWTHYDSSISAGGELPYSGLAVAVEPVHGNAPQVTVEGRAYYIDGTHPDKYILRISGAGAANAWLPLDLSDVPWGESLVRNVSAKEFTSAAQAFSRPPVYLTPNRIVQGSGNDVWVIDTAGSRVGRISAEGRVEMFRLALNSQPYDLAVRDDGTAWVTLSNMAAVRRVGETHDLGRVGPKESIPESIIAGGDGRLWFSERYAAFIGAIDADGTAQTYPLDKSEPWSRRDWIRGLVKGPDGNIWFAGFQSLGKIDPGGVVTRFKDVWGVATLLAGRDGYLWAAEREDGIARVSVDGSVKRFGLPLKGSYAVKLAQDTENNIWFLDEVGETLGHIDASGRVTQERLDPVIHQGKILDIAATPDGLVWFASASPNEVHAINGPIYETKSEPNHFFVAGDGVLWFTEEKANAVGFIRGGKLTEISLPR